MLESVRKHLDLLDARGNKYTIRNNNVYRIYKNVVIPFGPAKCDYTLDSKDAHRVLKEVGGLLIRMTDGFGENQCEKWYAVICDSFKSLDELKAKNRSEIKRGLKNCEIKHIDAEYVARNGYETYVEAYKSYKTPAAQAMEENEFKEQMLLTRPFDDIVHYWGAFHNNKLIAFGINNAYYPTEVTYWMIKLHPDYLKLYPSYALVYKMNEYYLGDMGYEYVNDGWKSVLHETNVQDFLIRKFSFRKAYSNLSIIYKRPFSFAVKAAYPFRSVLESCNKKAKALFEMEAIRRTCRK